MCRRQDLHDTSGLQRKMNIENPLTCQALESPPTSRGRNLHRHRAEEQGSGEAPQVPLQAFQPRTWQGQCTKSKGVPRPGTATVLYYEVFG